MVEVPPVTSYEAPVTDVARVRRCMRRPTSPVLTAAPPPWVPLRKGRRRGPRSGTRVRAVGIDGPSLSQAMVRTLLVRPFDRPSSTAPPHRSAVLHWYTPSTGRHPLRLSPDRPDPNVVSSSGRNLTPSGCYAQSHAVDCVSPVSRP